MHLYKNHNVSSGGDRDTRGNNHGDHCSTTSGGWMHEMRKRNGGGHHKMTAREIFQKRGGRDDVNFDVNDYKSSTMSISMEAKLMQLRSQRQL